MEPGGGRSRLPHKAGLPLAQFADGGTDDYASRVLRSVDRKRVLMKASLVNADGTHDVRVYDLTVSGARIACDRILPVDEDVIFKRGKLFVAARVAWSNRSGAGLEFYRDVPPSELAATFHAVFDAQVAAE
jgi:hypothetical protein